MKKFFCKLKSLFMFLLIIPMMFVFGGCKNNDNNAGSGNSGIEQPSGDDPQGGESGGEEDDPVVPPVVTEQTFNLSVNYALPAYVSDLIDDEELTPEVDTGYNLPTFEGTDFEDYFEGWYTTETYDEESKLEELNLTAEENENVSIYAKWNVNDIENYFCTDGVKFQFSGNVATPVEYIGTSEIVIISKYVMNGETPCYVDGIGANCFKNNNKIKEFRTSMLDFSVGESAFEGSTLEKLDFSKVIGLEINSFKGSKVKIAEFSNKLASISSNVFEGCTELETVDFSAVTNNLVSLIPSQMFLGCSKLKNIDLASTMTKIYASAFENCSALKNIEFLKNSSIVEVANRAFANCVSLDNIEIPESIVSYGTGVFAGSNITNMTISNMFYNSVILDFSFSTKFGDLSSTLKSLTFKGTSITKIYANYLSGYSELETLVMNDSIIEIEGGAFSGCSKLKNITFSTALVGDKINISTLSKTKWYSDIQVYLESESLNEMIVNDTLLYVSSEISGEYVVPENVTHIVADIFSKNNNITSVVISKNVVGINRYAFYKSNVTNISVDSDNKHYVVDKGELEKFEGGMVLQDTTINYSALYELNSGVKSTLVSYVANVDGGLFIVPESVKLVYNSAFNSNCVPYFVYVSTPNSLVNLSTKFAVEERKPAGGYLFGDSLITTESYNVSVSIYKYLEGDKYDVYLDPISIEVNFEGLTGNYFVKVLVDDFAGTVAKYYLVKSASEEIVDLTTIYPNFNV